MWGRRPTRDAAVLDGVCHGTHMFNDIGVTGYRLSSAQSSYYFLIWRGQVGWISRKRTDLALFFALNHYPEFDYHQLSPVGILIVGKIIWPTTKFNNVISYFRGHYDFSRLWKPKRGTNLSGVLRIYKRWCRSPFYCIYAKSDCPIFGVSGALFGWGWQSSSVHILLADDIA